jgi:NADH:ubiquinone oxidoreductase subunit 6 (subunit J)
VLMLLNVKSESHIPEGGTLRGLAVTLALLFLAQLGTVFVRSRFGPGAADFRATAEDVAKSLFSARFLYVFEASSVLILAALVGSIVLASRDGKREDL